MRSARPCWDHEPYRQGEVMNMIAEISVIPETDGSARELIPELLGEIAGAGLRYEVGALGTSVEGELDEILDAVRSIERRLEAENVRRALIDLRLQIEPHPETIEHQVEGMAVRVPRRISAEALR